MLVWGKFQFNVFPLCIYLKSSIVSAVDNAAKVLLVAEREQKDHLSAACSFTY